jgi:RHS repeat-associated protein
VTDSDQFAGTLFEEIVDNGSAVVTDTVTTPWSSQTADEAQPGSLPDLKAFLTGSQESQTFTALASGGYRESDVTYGHDSDGRVIWQASAPDVSSSDGPSGGAAEDTCTQTSYPAAGSAYLLDLPAEIVTTSVAPAACPITLPPSSGQLVSDARYYYDGASSLTTAPTEGNLTKTQKATSYSGTTEEFTTESESAFDEYGRTTSFKDGDSIAGDDGSSDPATVTAYTPATGAEPTSEKVTDPEGLVTTTTYDPLRELPLTVTNPAGGVTTETYDALGRLTSVWTPGHAATGQAEYTFAYTVNNAGPSLITTKTLEPDGSYQTSETIFDSLGRSRETQTSTAAGNRDVTDTLYNSDGWASLQSSAYWTSGAPSATLVAASSDEVPDQTGYVYDGAGRLIKTITYSDANEQYETDTAYGGNYTTTSYASDTVPVGGSAQTEYTNGAGQLTYVYQYHSADPASTAGLDSGDQTSPVAWDQTAYTYWPAGQLHTVTDAAGNKWTDAYDFAGDETSSADPDRGTTTAAYDPDGNVVSTTTGNGSVSFSYDADGRKIAEWSGTTPGTPGAPGMPGTPAASQLAMWEYDSIKPGLPTESVSYVGGSGSGGQAYTEAVMGYDGYDLPTGTETIIPAGSPVAGTYFTEDAYTSSGQLSSYTDGAAAGLPAETVDFSYDSDGQPTSMAGTWAYTDSLDYTELGQPDEYQLGSSAEPAYLTDSYNSLNQLTSAVTTTGTSPVTVDDQSYSYDSAADVLSEDDVPASGKPEDQCFSYNGLDQLSQAWSQGTASCGTASAAAEAGSAAPYWEQYTYNDENDLLAETSTPPAGAATTDTIGFAPAGSSQPHAPASQSVVTGSGGPAVTSYAYNTAGDLTTITPPSGPASDLTWNPAGQLTAITPAGSGTATASYVYDAAGSLLEQSDGTTTTLYLPDEQITSSNGTLSGTRYYTIGAVTIAARTSAGDVQYLIGNQQGTDTLAIDSATLATTRRYFDPYGNPVGTAPQGWPGNKSFVGGTTDTATGLTNLGVREYNPVTGAFISPDSVLTPNEPADLNPYAYADDNPVSDADPTGRECVPGAAANGNCNDKQAQGGSGGGSGGSGGSGGGSGDGWSGYGQGGGPSGTHCTPMTCYPVAPPPVNIVRQFIDSIYTGDPNGAQQTRALTQAYNKAMAMANNDPKVQWSMLLGVCRQFGCSASVTATVQTEAFNGRVDDIWSHWRGMLQVGAFGVCALTAEIGCAVMGVVAAGVIGGDDIANHDYWGAAGTFATLGLGDGIDATYHSFLGHWIYNLASSAWGFIPDPANPPDPFCPVSACGAGTPIQRHLELNEEAHLTGYPSGYGENGLSTPG